MGIIEKLLNGKHIYTELKPGMTQAEFQEKGFTQPLFKNIDLDGNGVLSEHEISVQKLFEDQTRVATKAGITGSLFGAGAGASVLGALKAAKSGNKKVAVVLALLSCLLGGACGNAITPSRVDIAKNM